MPDAVEHMPVVGTRDPKRKVMVPRPDTEREELRTAGNEGARGTTEAAGRAGRRDGSAAAPIP